MNKDSRFHGLAPHFDLGEYAARFVHEPSPDRRVKYLALSLMFGALRDHHGGKPASWTGPRARTEIWSVSP